MSVFLLYLIKDYSYKKEFASFGNKLFPLKTVLNLLSGNMAELQHIICEKGLNI